MKILHVLEEEHETLVLFHCPGCECDHPFRVRASDGLPNASVWIFNENMEKPTFSPSLLVFGDIPDKRCHSFVTDGQIHFLNDCHHSLAGKTVEMVEIDW